MAGMTLVTYELSTLMNERYSMPKAAIRLPKVASGRGPILGSS